jgi:type IV secretory pathway VirJ component
MGAANGRAAVCSRAAALLHDALERSCLKRIHCLLFAALMPALAPPAAGAQSAPSAAESAAAEHPHKTPARKKKAPPAHDAAAFRYVNVAGFGEVAVYKPAGQSRGLALFASGDGGWNLGVLDMAHEAVGLGFWVAGFSTPQFLKALDADEGECSDADGRLAKLGEAVVREFGLPIDTRPIVIGYSSGATIVYAALAEDAGHTLGGGISLGFCPDLLIKKPFCPGRGGLAQQKQQVAPFGYVFDKRETVQAPWRILQGEADQVCDPKFAPEFVQGQADAKAVMLPKVGHGFGVPKNWMPQYRDSVREVLEAKH